jgi:hypothetical protein
MGLCCSFAFMLTTPESVQRKDGTMCKLAEPPTIASEVKGIVSVFTDPKMLSLVPLFLYTNWCYTYQFQEFNVGIFNTRTTGFNSFLYWGAQVLYSLYTLVLYCTHCIHCTLLYSLYALYCTVLTVYTVLCCTR